MNIKVKLAVILTFLIITGTAGFLVFHSEQEKQQKKYAAQLEYYNNQYASWKQYQKEYQDQVNQLIQENKASMEATKADYDRLLAQQPELIRTHTRTVAQGTTTPTSGGTTVSSGTQTTTKTVTVKKPSSTPKTKTS